MIISIAGVSIEPMRERSVSACLVAAVLAKDSDSCKVPLTGAVVLLGAPLRAVLAGGQRLPPSDVLIRRKSIFSQTVFSKPFSIS